MPRRPDIALSRETILTGAFDLMEAEGLDALSMRRLAARLSVQAPALYWHVRDKEQLLGMMAARIYAEARAAVRCEGGWREWLIAFGAALHCGYRDRRDAARLCSIARPVRSEAATAADAIAAPLVALGLEREKALAFQASVISLTLGWAVFEVNGPMHEFLSDMMDVGQSYADGLEALVRGYPEP